MKTKILTGLFIISLIMLSSCNWIDPSKNIDPTSPSDASFATILPTTQIGLAYVVGGDVGRFTSLFTQHHMGIARQHALLYNYFLNESDLDNAWTTMYSGPMEDFELMIQKAKATNSPYYGGISKILMAYSVAMWTDILGDVPYSDAFKGQASVKPKYDAQSTLYPALLALLDDGIKDCSASSSVHSPKSDDFIYGGIMANWIKAAHTLKARLYLHIKDYANCLAELPQGIASNADDMEVVFGDNESTANPFYQFNSQRGDISMGPELMTLMAGFKDPRIVTYTGDTVYSTSAYPAGYFANPNSPVFLLTYVEAKFMEAECQLNGGNTTAAYSAYTAAIQASMDKYGIDAGSSAAYLANPKVAVGASSLALKNVIEQKYIAMYTQWETWSDWRRTALPALTPTRGAQIPTRFIYPQSERLFNGDNLAATGYVPNANFIFTKFWWLTKW